MPKEEIGLILLGVGSSFGIWSACNTSPVGTVEFGTSNPEVMRQGMYVGLGAILAMAGGIYSLYGQKGVSAAAATALTGVGLYVWYQYLLANAPAQAISRVTPAVEEEPPSFYEPEV